METLRPSNKELTYLLLLSLGSIATGVLAVSELPEKIKEKVEDYCEPS